MSRDSPPESKTKLYGVWLAMRRRCYLESDGSYNSYGARGIAVCDEWRNSFSTFKQWALENGYAEGIELDRINVNGNYEPNNCRWTTRLGNARNKRSTVFLEIDGVTKTLQEWAIEKEFLPSTIRERYNKGLRGDELFKPLLIHNPPKSKPKVFVEINGESKSLREWSEISGINIKTIEFRYNQKGIRDGRLIEPVKNKGEYQ